MTTKEPLKKIAVTAGPEDMNLITIDGRPQILVSSTPRRGTVFHSIISTQQGAFNFLDPETDDVHIIPVLGQDGKELVPFRPHGIYVDPDSQRVVAVSHEPTDTKYGCADHALVLEYHEGAFHLLHRSTIRVMGNKVGENDANDIVFRNGVIFVSMLSSNCVAYAAVPENGGDWVWKQIEHVRLANGMEFHQDAFLVCSSLPGIINAYPLDADGMPGEERKHLKGLGGVLDNFTRSPGDTLYLAAIANPIRYLIHSVLRWVTSPTRFYEVQLGDEVTAKEIFLKGGKRIPIQGGSTILRYNDTFYFSQVFEPWILKVHADQIEYKDR